MTLDRGYRCDVVRKRNLNEHQFYWEIPKRELDVATDDVRFTDNPVVRDDRIVLSDGYHRVFANYFDHVGGFVDFEPLDENFLRKRIERLSDLVNDSLTLPNYTRYPNFDAVHVIAYARIVKFRQDMDAVVKPTNRYWVRYRDPSWFKKYMDFQVPVGTTLSFVDRGRKHT